MQKYITATILIILAALIFIIGIQPEFRGAVNLATTFQSTGGTIPSHVPQSVVIHSESAQEAANTLLERAAYILLGFAGTIAIFFVTWAGFKLILARGDEEAVKKGHQTLLWAIVGFLLVILSYGIVVNIGNIIYSLIGR